MFISDYNMKDFANELTSEEVVRELIGKEYDVSY